MNLSTKEELIHAIGKIIDHGWYKSVREIKDTRNGGAVGNTLENLLGIEENNLPIPNANEWELKGQRLHTASLVSLKHYDPSPRAAYIVPRLLLPNYGWKHKKAGTEYPITAMSFRSTTGATDYTNRGFKIVVDKSQRKIRFVFNSNKVDTNSPEIREWLDSVEKRIGLGPLNPEPYWGFDDLKYVMGSKIRNCFYVTAESKVENRQEYFSYKELYILSGYSFEKLIACIENGTIKIDFDARTGKNHGVKFRIKRGAWKDLYSNVYKAI